MRSTATNQPRHGEGSLRELALAKSVATAVARVYNVELSDFFIAGHTHEELPQGSVSIAWEGGEYGWACDFPETSAAADMRTGMGIWFEAINGCTLAVHRNQED
jgi:hypothetical protein